MLSTQTRALMLNAGRASLNLMVRAGHITEPKLASDAQVVYGRMAERVQWPADQVSRVHLALFILPAGALYSALREGGRTESDAVDAVDTAVRTLFGPARHLIKLYSPLLRTKPGRRVFLQAWSWYGQRFFPAPVWQTTFERSEDRLAMDVTRCYYVDTLRQLGVSPVAKVACTADVYLFTDVCPQLRWTRTGTLATGASHCDICYEVLPRHTKDRERRAAESGPRPPRVSEGLPR